MNFFDKEALKEILTAWVLSMITLIGFYIYMIVKC